MCPLLQHRAPASPREAHSAQLAINLRRTYTQLLMSHSTECISLKGCEVRARWCEIDCYGCQAPSAHKHCTARSRMSISTMLQGTRVAWLRTSQTGSAECGTSRDERARCGSIPQADGGGEGGVEGGSRDQRHLSRAIGKLVCHILGPSTYTAGRPLSFDT